MTNTAGRRPHLAQVLSAQYAGRHCRASLSVGSCADRRFLQALQQPHGLHLHGQDHHLWRDGKVFHAGRRLAAIARAGKGRPGGADDAQCAPDAGGDGRVCCARATAVVNVNALYTPARNLNTSSRIRAPRRSSSSRISPVTLEQVIARTDVKHVCVATMGDMLGLKGHIVNFVVRKVKKKVPAWSLPGHVSFKAALTGRRRQVAEPADTKPDDGGVPAIYRRHHRRFQGRDAFRIPTCCRMRRRTTSGSRRPSTTAPGPDVLVYGLRAAALSHLRAHSERADGHAARALTTSSSPTPRGAFRASSRSSRRSSSTSSPASHAVNALLEQ